MAQLDLIVEVPTVDELVHQWSLAVEPRTWVLEILGSRYSIQYVPNGEAQQKWRANAPNCTQQLAPSFEQLLHQLAADWHLAVCTTIVADHVKAAAEATAAPHPTPAFEPRSHPDDLKDS